MRLISRRAFCFCMAKEGFNNQWIEICRVGEFVDVSGQRIIVDDQFINEAITNFNADHHEPPVVIGHPDLDAPAFGWTRELRRNADRMEARFADTNDDFEELVRSGAFRKRSSAFYLAPTATLKHVGFLGAMPPAIKGLKNIKFAEGETVTFERSFNFNEEIKMGLEDKDIEKVTEGVLEKVKNFFTKQPPPTILDAEKPATVAFSEAAVKTMIADQLNEVEQKAYERATAQFAEELKTRDTKIESLMNSVNSQSATGRRAEIASFFDRQGANKITPALKKLGIVEFAESLAIADAADKDKAVACFAEGADGVAVEHKLGRLEWFQNFVEAMSPYVSFGESFGNLKATTDVDESVDADSLEEMRDAMGINKTGGEK